MRFLAAVLMLALLAKFVGCQPASAPKPSKPAGKTGNPSGVASAGKQPLKARAVAPPPLAARPKTPVAADAFPDVPAAVAALAEGLSSGDRAKIDLARGWLELQGAQAAQPLASAAGDRGSQLSLRLAACDGLGSLGEHGIAALATLLNGDEGMLRVKAAEELGTIRPVKQEAVAALVAALGHNDERTVQYAARALGQMGEAAKDAAPALVKILNGSAGDSVRAQAGDALKKVAPRKKFEIE